MNTADLITEVTSTAYKTEHLAKHSRELSWRGVARSRGALNWVELDHWRRSVT